MAVAFSTHSLSFAPRIISFRKPLKTLELKLSTFSSIQQCHLQSKSNLGFRIVPRCFKSSLRIDDDQESEPEPETSDREDYSEIKSEGKVVQNISNMKTLIEVYKEAVLDGDTNTVSNLEAMIYIMENEKNKLVKKVAELAADIASGKENHIRLQADFENFRKRSEKDRLTLTSNGQREVIESLLSIVDNFEKAKQQVIPETEKGKKINASYQGIYKQFVETLRSLHVSVVETVGKPFDPSVHEAIAREESQKFKEGIIIKEICRGFILGDRLLRPAKVKVSAGPGRKAPIATEESIGQTAAMLD